MNFVWITSCHKLLRPKIAFLLWLTLFFSSACVQAEPTWNPKRSWALIVSALEWQHSDIYESFPKDNRRDVRLVQALKVQGVPSNQIVLLQDKAATLKNIRNELNRLCKEVSEGDTLWVYYAGHGARDEKTKKFYMVPYDGNDYDTLWSQDEAAAVIDRCGKTVSVFWAADCCYSGCLADWAQKGSNRPRVAIASSSRELESTGNWTFSDCLVDGLIGNPVADTNNDGKISLTEIGELVQREMRFIENQTGSLTISQVFPSDTTMVKTTRPRRESEGDLVKVKYDGSYWKARVLELRGSQVYVHWVGTPTDYPDEWVPANTVRWSP